MILNERQYKITKAQADTFLSSINDLDSDSESNSGLHPAIAKAQRDQVVSEYENLVNQMDEYNALIGGDLTEFEAESIQELPIMLIKGRIARNWTQKDLADALGLKPQQIQRYEADLYRSANLKTLSLIADTIGMRVSENAALSTPTETDSNDISSKFPIAEMLKRGWFEDFGGTLTKAKRKSQSLMESFYRNANLSRNVLAHHRKMIRSKGIMNEYALSAWQVRAISLAGKQKLRNKYAHAMLTPDWFRELAKLSQDSDGPSLAKDWLLESGIHFVTEKHLQHTHLDGAALRHPNGSPIVALTLRRDRLDNFWFVLFHELAHIALHFPASEDTDYFDDADAKSNDIEKEADIFALNALIPNDEWENCLSRFSLTTELIHAEAKKFRVHPSILAGRIRYEQDNYLILNDVIGLGQVRNKFDNFQH